MSQSLKNRFDKDELQTAWAFWHRCMWCGRAGSDAFHHTKSPGSLVYVKGSFNNSMLNSYPIHNFKCHIGNPELHKLENEKTMLRQVIKALLFNGYELNEKDVCFYREYRDHYEDIDKRGDRGLTRYAEGL